LVSLSQAPSAIRAAANCYCQLLVSQSDNNVKLIVLERLLELKDKHRDVMQDVLMDILRALSSPNMDIRKKTLDISMDLITSRNIDEVRCIALHGDLSVVNCLLMLVVCS
jgi:coatomer subunit beta